MATRFEVYRTGADYRWRLSTTARDVAAFGPRLPTKAAAIRDIEAVRQMIAEAPINESTNESRDDDRALTPARAAAHD